jgi:hypothetical protein
VANHRKKALKGGSATTETLWRGGPKQFVVEKILETYPTMLNRFCINGFAIWQLLSIKMIWGKASQGSARTWLCAELVGYSYKKLWRENPDENKILLFLILIYIIF